MAETTGKVWWAVLLERQLSGVCASSIINVAIMGERRGYTRMPVSYTRTDLLRNAIAAQFLELSKDPHDTLIMLDNDHDHPPDVLFGLARHDSPVTGGLAFRRGPPYDACVYVRDEEGNAHAMAEWKAGGVYRCQVIGHAAIAIQRRTFLTLEAQGFPRPWWRYVYTDGTLNMPSEDFYFCERLCDAGIPIICDTAVISPHFTTGWVDDKTWEAYKRDHPELVSGEAKPDKKADYEAVKAWLYNGQERPSWIDERTWETARYLHQEALIKPEPEIGGA